MSAELQFTLQLLYAILFSVIHCPKLPELQHGLWINNSTSYGITAGVLCDNGYAVHTGTEDYTCLVSGEWSGDVSLVRCEGE